MAARQTALGALIACRKQGAWSDGVLKEYVRRDQLDRREAALAARLCYGVLQNRMAARCLTTTLTRRPSLARLFWLPAMRGKSGRSMGISACWWI